MTINSFNDYSTTPANNTDIAGTDINIGCAPQDVGVYMRTLLSQIAYAVQGTPGLFPNNWHVVNLTATGVVSSTGSAASAPLTGWELSSSGTAAFGPGTIGYGFLANGANMLATAYFAASDVRVKYNIRDVPLSRALQWVEGSRPVTYMKRAAWNSDAAMPEAGFIAQEQVRLGFGEYVDAAPCPGMPGSDESPADVMLTLSPTYQIAFLTTVVKSLLARIEILEKDRAT